MLRCLLYLLLLCPLLGCNGSSDAAAASPVPAAASVAKAGVTLRIVRRTRPDPAWMLKDLESRMDLCMVKRLMPGYENMVRPVLPSAADIAKWVTMEKEELYAGERRASYSMLAVVWPDLRNGCRLMFYKQISASTETLCGASYAGTAHVGAGGAPPGRDDPGAPVFSERSLEDIAQDAKYCRARPPRKRSTSNVAQGITRGGELCYWLGDEGKPGDGPTEPSDPGAHACMHPRDFDGSLPLAQGDDALTLRTFLVLVPGKKPGGVHMPENNLGRSEAEIVEEGKPIPDSRFSREAVQAFVRQPLVVPVQGSSDAGK